MAEAFRESNTHLFRDMVTFQSGFGVVADQPFQIGSQTTTNSDLITHDSIIPWGGISGYLTTGQLINSNFFVNTTGDQTVSGLKTFDNGISTINIASTYGNSIDFSVSRIKDTSNVNAINWASRLLQDSNGISTMQWGNRKALDTSTAVAIDWSGRILSGSWNILGELRMSGSSVSIGGGSTDVNAYNPVYTTGKQNINDLKTFSGALFTGYFSGIHLTGWIITAKNYLVTDKIYSNVLADTYIDVATSQMYNSAPAVSLDWNNMVLYQDGSPMLEWGNQRMYSNWSITGLNSLQTLKVSGQSVITGGHLPTRFYTGNATGSFSPGATGQFTLDWASGNTFNYTMTGHTKFNFINDKDGQTIVFGLANTGNGRYSGVWPENIRWPSNTIPAQSTGALAYIDIYTFIKMGTGIYGNVVPSFIKF